MWLLCLSRDRGRSVDRGRRRLHNVRRSGVAGQEHRVRLADRIGPDGVWRNANSAATYINLDRFARVDVPDKAEGGAEPDWVQVSTEPTYVWHDHRTHWMSENQLPPVVAW